MDALDLWAQYMGPYVSPEEYQAAGPVTLERLKADLRDLWAMHAHDAMTDDEIADVAARLLKLFQRDPDTPA